MRVLKVFLGVIAGFIAITALFAATNAARLLTWQTMEILWLFYPGFISLICAYVCSKYYLKPGSGIFFAFCFVGFLTLASYYLNLPWGDFFFRPAVLLTAGFLAIIGEAINRRVIK